MNEPDLVLFDEPTSRARHQARRTGDGAHPHRDEGRGTAAIVVTHDERMTHYGDRTVHIVDGVLGLSPVGPRHGGH